MLRTNVSRLVAVVFLSCSEIAVAESNCELSDVQIGIALSMKERVTASVIATYSSTRELIAEEFRFFAHDREGNVDLTHSIQYLEKEGMLLRTWVGDQWMVVDVDGRIYRIETEAVFESRIFGGQSLSELIEPLKGVNFSPDDLVPQNGGCGETATFSVSPAALRARPAPFGSQNSAIEATLSVSPQLKVTEMSTKLGDGRLIDMKFFYGAGRSFGLSVPRGGKRVKTLEELESALSSD